jgi:hypothetical protein
VLEKGGKGCGVRPRAEARGVCKATIRRRLTRIALESRGFKGSSFYATTCTSTLRSGHRQMEPVDKFKGKQSRCVAALQKLKDKRAKAKAAHAITEDVDSDDLTQGGNAGHDGGGKSSRGGDGRATPDAETGSRDDSNTPPSPNMVGRGGDHHEGVEAGDEEIHQPQQHKRTREVGGGAVYKLMRCS